MFVTLQDDLAQLREFEASQPDPILNLQFRQEKAADLAVSAVVEVVRAIAVSESDRRAIEAKVASTLVGWVLANCQQTCLAEVALRQPSLSVETLRAIEGH